MNDESITAHEWANYYEGVGLVLTELGLPVADHPIPSFAWVEITPSGSPRPWRRWRRRRIVMWWLKRRGWVFFYGNGIRA